MGREILFRGKRIDNGEWVEGFYVKHDSRHWIYTGEIQYMYLPVCAELPKKYEVEPEYICEYTGLTDKNGRKIFEGDIVKAEFSFNDFARDRVEHKEYIYEISYHEKHCYFYLKRKNNNLLFDGNWSYQAGTAGEWGGFNW